VESAVLAVLAVLAAAFPEVLFSDCAPEAQPDSMTVAARMPNTNARETRNRSALADTDGPFDREMRRPGGSTSVAVCERHSISASFT
jgi:hypothetical protein